MSFFFASRHVATPPVRPALQRTAGEARLLTGVPSAVGDVLRSPGQALDPAARAALEPRFGHDFSRVRVHADSAAAESARAVNALAYTAGPHVVFDAGRYAPATSEGRKLLAHELTHVVQQSGQNGSLQANPALGQPGDAFEQEADAAAEQATSGGQTRAIHAAGPAIMRQQAEDPALRSTRLQAAGQMRTAATNFSRALSARLAWGGEKIVAQGNQMVVGNKTVLESMSNRQSRLTQLMKDLIRFSTVLESGPVPAAWLPPPVKMPAGTFEGASVDASTQSSFGNGPDWEDALRYYSNWQLARGQDSGLLTVNLNYIPDPPLPTPIASIPRSTVSATGIQTGTFIIVPDPVNRPLDYQRLTGTGQYWNSKEQPIEVWHDDLGYYYLDRGQRHYLPGRP
jgi:hypothetical protein